MFLKKAVKLVEYQDVNLSLITQDKIVGDVHNNSVMDILPISIANDCVIAFSASAKLNRFDFEVYFDLPF